MSGSSFHLHRRLVKALARTSEVVTCNTHQSSTSQISECQTLTARQKNSTENAMNTNGSFTHPNARTRPRKNSSTGNATAISVSMTNRALGGGGLGMFPASRRMGRAAACNAVDCRDTKIDPALPGKPNPEDGMSNNHDLTPVNRTRTGYHDSEEGESTIAAHKDIKHDPCRAADDHCTEQWRPALGEQRSHILVTAYKNRCAHT
jgi:hypothetical protein